jgi:hypothetical protein
MKSEESRYCTTIRRVQGASLEHGCIYFDQKHHEAGRGYGYVAVSRFRSRAGVYLFGTLRRTDFLPVGGDGTNEQVERGIMSESSDSEEGHFAHELSDEEGSESEVGEAVIHDHDVTDWADMC